MNENHLTNEALEGKIEYIDKVMEYFNYAESHNVKNVTTFLKAMIENDKELYIMLVDGNLNRLSEEEQ